MKTVTSSSQENTRKISKQFLFFGVILVRSPCHYYNVKKKTSCAFTSQKMRTHVTIVFAWSEITVWYLYCGVTELFYLACLLAACHMKSWHWLVAPMKHHYELKVKLTTAQRKNYQSFAICIATQFARFKNNDLEVPISYVIWLKISFSWSYSEQILRESIIWENITLVWKQGQNLRQFFIASVLFLYRSIF